MNASFNTEAMLTMLEFYSSTKTVGYYNINRPILETYVSCSSSLIIAKRGLIWIKICKCYLTKPERLTISDTDIDSHDLATWMNGLKAEPGSNFGWMFS